jgi:hypothetical protein
MLGALLLGGASPAAAQGGPEGSLSSGDSFTHRFAGPGQATMTVYLWGSVGRSGIWEIERDTEIVELLSAANVPGLGADQVETRERLLLRIYRQQSAERSEVYEESLEDVLETGTQAPQLQEGDVLVIETQTRRRLSLQTITRYVGTLSSVALLVLRFVR